MVESLATRPSEGQGRRVLVLLGILAVLGGVIVGGQQLGGEASELAQHGVLAGPALALAGLLQLARLWGWLRWPAWVWFWLVLLAIGGFTLLVTISALDVPSPAAQTPEQAFMILAAIGLVGLAGLLAMIVAASGAWHVLARAFRASVDRREPAHAQGFILLLFGIAVAAVPLIVLGGRAPLLLLIERDTSWLGNRSDVGQILDLYYSLVWTIPLAFLAVGLPVRRTLAQSLDRLGLGPLGRRDVLIVIVVAVALVFAANELDELLARLWEAAGWPRTDAKLVERLFGAAVSPIGAVSVAISAGVGEELIARGLFQPRFGWLLPNLAFAMAHAFQYGPDSVVSVFLTGAVLAAVRARWNTTASALTHGLYDFILVFASTVDLPGF